MNPAENLTAVPANNYVGKAVVAMRNLLIFNILGALPCDREESD